MDGLEAVELKLSEVLDDNDTFRIDSLFFKKEVLAAIKNIKIKDYVLNRDISIIGSGTTPTVRDENLKHGIVLLKTNNIRNNVLTDKKDDFFYIDEKTDLKMKSSSLVCNDVLINIVGATTDVIGRSAIVFEGFPKANITQAMAFSRIHDMRFLASYLFILFQTYYGQIQVKRLARPTGQYNLNLDEVGKFIIPYLSLSLQQNIETLVKLAHVKLEESKKLYSEAEELLLEELQLNDFTPSNECVAIKSFSESFGSSGRLDAEYYQLKYDDIIGRIKNYRSGFDLVKNQFLQNKTSYEKTQDSYDYIEISDVNVSNGEITPNSVLVEELPANAKNKVSKGDILVSKVRPYRGAVGIIEFEQEDLICSGAFTVLRENGQINKETLITLFRLSFYKELLLKYNVGTSYPVIKDEDVLNMPIPLIDENIQKIIAEKISESFTLRAESKRLLEEAKIAVERAIEKGEEQVMGLLNA